MQRANCCSSQWKNTGQLKVSLFYLMSFDKTGDCNQMVKKNQLVSLHKLHSAESRGMTHS